MTDPERIARDVVVEGRVQGVFFRDSCRREAQRSGVAGWVSNARDGSVRAHLEGSPEDVERLLAWLHHGPPSAHVERVDVHSGTPEGLRRFEVR